MNIKEKILLVQLLLLDIRCNWGKDTTPSACSRAKKAKELCDEIAEELKDDNFCVLSGICSEYISYSEEESDGVLDGRFFREDFPEGYEEMDKLHGLNYTFIDKSDDFKLIAKEYLTYPEDKFEDWPEK